MDRDDFVSTGDPSEQPRDDAELLDALRLAEALERVEYGQPSGLDAIEDPELTGLLRTATLLRGELSGAGNGHAYRSFHSRSRAAVLHALETGVVETPVPANVVPFYRRSAVMRPFAAVATAAAIVVAAMGGAAWTTRGNAGGSVAQNLTPRSTTEELDRLTVTLADIQTHADAGQPVPAPLLRALSEGTARVANIIEQQPDQVSKAAVRAYIQAAQAGQTVLSTATVDQDAQGALAAAQRAARDGVVVATRYLGDTATATPTATGTATGTPTATGTATGTPTVTATPGTKPTGTPTAGTASATPTATPTAPADDIVR